MTVNQSPPLAFESRNNALANGSEVGSRVSKQSSRSDVAVRRVRLDNTRQGSSNSSKQSDPKTGNGSSGNGSSGNSSSNGGASGGSSSGGGGLVDLLNGLFGG